MNACPLKRRTVVRPSGALYGRVCLECRSNLLSCAMKVDVVEMAPHVGSRVVPVLEK
jgi:hypothetical protein